jgi:hypothetical protein
MNVTVAAGLMARKNAAGDVDFTVKPGTGGWRKGARQCAGSY